MKIKAFILTFNESDIIRFTIKHYKQFCSEIHIYDNWSTDKTRQICTDMGCIMHTFGQEGVLDDREYLKVKNNCWKEHQDADFVIICDADEILYWHEQFLSPVGVSIFKQYHIFKSVGYNIYSEDLPIKSWNEMNQGYDDKMYNKVCMFSPKQVREINYGFGCHGCKPEVYAGTTFSDKEVILRHMRYVGGVERMINRYDLYKSRMCEFNKINALGYQYFRTPELIKNDWELSKIKSQQL